MSIKDDTIEIRDVDGDTATAWKGSECDEPKAVVTLRIDTSTPLLHLSKKEAAKLATFLLDAIGPDAAREALAKLAPGPFAGETPLKTTARIMREKNAAEARAEAAEVSAGQAFAEADALRARASLAEKRLAAVLALVADWRGLATSSTAGEAFKEGVAYCAKKLERELRATDGVEAPTGATT